MQRPGTLCVLAFVREEEEKWGGRSKARRSNRRRPRRRGGGEGKVRGGCASRKCVKSPFGGGGGCPRGRWGKTKREWQSRRGTHTALRAVACARNPRVAHTHTHTAREAGAAALARGGRRGRQGGGSSLKVVVCACGVCKRASWPCKIGHHVQSPKATVVIDHPSSSRRVRRVWRRASAQQHTRCGTGGKKGHAQTHDTHKQRA